MSRFDLLRRTLAHYARSLLAVAAGVATATAVIVGALLVGDSVRGSLAQMTLDRLGRVDAVVTSPIMVTQDLSDRLFGELFINNITVAPGILLPGTLRNPETKAVTQVDVIGIDSDGWSLLNTERPDADLPTITHGTVGGPVNYRFVPNEAAVRAIPSPVESSTPEEPAEAVEAPRETVFRTSVWDVPPPRTTMVGPFPSETTSLESTVVSTTYRLLVELPSAIPRDTLLGDRDEQVIEMSVRLNGDGTTISNPIETRSTTNDFLRRWLPFLGRSGNDLRHDVIREGPFPELAVAPPQVGASRFSLSPSQQLPRLSYIELSWLQEQLDLSPLPASRFNPTPRPARINTLLFGRGYEADAFKDELGFEPEVADHEALIDVQRIAEALRETITLDDLDLRVLATDDGGASIETRSLILPSGLEQAAKDAAGDGASSVLVYLVNEIRSVADPAKYAAYSVAAGVDLETAGFTFIGPEPSFPLAEDAVLINQWLAEDLGAAVGDAIEVDAFPAGSIGDVPAETLSLTVAGIVAMEGDGANSSLTPSVPGITDADSFADWEQPFDMDLDRVTDRDEEYWDEYRAAPKLFFPLAAMQDRFASRYGRATSVRLPGGGEPVDIDALKARLRDAIDPAAIGLVVQPVKQQQLAAAAGTTDFSGLFLGFSFFLIASAVLLVGLLFRLGIEQRANQLGLLGAVGFPPRKVRRQLLIEGLIVAVVGGLLGVLGGVLFARVMIHGLTTWWAGAIGTQFLELHVQPGSLAIGLVASLITALLAMWWAVRRLHTLSPRGLLAGQTTAPLDDAGEASQTRLAKRITIGAAAGAGLLLLLVLTGALGDGEAFAGFSLRVIGFFLVGMLSLVAAIGGLAMFLDQLSGGSTRSLTRLSYQNAARARGRSLLTASLIASATFVLVAVATAKRDPSAEAPRIDSGNGGYLLIAETAAPVLYDLNTPEGRRDAGFEADDGPLAEVRIDGLRRRPGDDASCLNLYRSNLPTLLGVPDDLLQKWSDEGRFRFADTPDEGRWGGLMADPAVSADGSRVYPVIGDLNTIRYSLHLGIGQSLPLPQRDDATDEPGDALQIIGMLDSSVFQGVLLMRESHLLELFPDIAGDRTFLVQADPDQAADLSALLERGLAGYGFDAEPVGDRIANFLAVQNTYLSTFQALGGLGLLLGTIGLATVLLRNVTERRSELALLRAVGYQPARLASLVGDENVLLLGWGLLAGTAAALLAMLPHLLSTGAAVPWKGLAYLLAAIFFTGILACGAAIYRAVRTPIVGMLRS